MNIRCFCCMGDSITSDQVSGIGTMVAHRLNAQEVLRVRNLLRLARRR